MCDPVEKMTGMPRSTKDYFFNQEGNTTQRALTIFDAERFGIKDDKKEYSRSPLAKTFTTTFKNTPWVSPISLSPKRNLLKDTVLKETITDENVKTSAGMGWSRKYNRKAYQSIELARKINSIKKEVKSPKRKFQPPPLSPGSIKTKNFK